MIGRPVSEPPIHVSEASTAPSHQGRSPSAEVERARRIEGLYLDFVPKLKAALFKAFGAGPPDPEDVVQQAFQKFLERKDKDKIDNPNAFLWRTARNIVLEAKRKTTVHSKYNFEIEQIFFPLRGENSTPESILSAKEELETINRALEKMPPKRRRAFFLHKVEGLTISEVARRLNISRSPAQKHITKAMKDIAIALDAQQLGRKS